MRSRGDDQYAYRDDVPVPTPGPLDVLVAVEAAGLNNTDINVRADWYGGQVDDSGLHFPRIQGADATGRVVAAGRLVDEARIGERVICDPHLRLGAERRPARTTTAGYLGFDVDGGYAEYVVVPAVNAWPVREDLAGEELAAFPWPTRPRWK